MRCWGINSQRAPEGKRRVVVIGGGPAGMMAAIQAARAGAQVTLLEKNDRLGKKLRITGKGRCNLTTSKPFPEMVDSFLHNPKFLYSALRHFSNQDVMAYFEELGVPLKIERGERVFPASDDARDVIQALARALKQAGVQVILGQEVVGIFVNEAGMVSGVHVAGGKKHLGDAVVIATGGLSYPVTGSTGDGYRFAKTFGHQIITPRPALVPLNAQEKWVKDLQGLSLRNVRLTLQDEAGKIIGEDFGEMLFTHFGVSGPIVLTLSAAASDYWEKHESPLSAVLDLKPALRAEQLDARLLREIEEQGNKQFKNSLGSLLPEKMIPVVIALSGIDGQKVMHQVTREERKTLGHLLKNMTFHLSGTRSIDEGIVTAGGVSVKEIVPKTMASKLVAGLYFAGEVIDVDGITGGLNLQAAFSTGAVAGQSAAQDE